MDGCDEAGEVGEALRDDWQRPHPSRLSPGDPFVDEIARRHDAAIASRIPTYVDPVSGYSVFTARTLARRGSCCTSGCRHCPYII